MSDENWEGVILVDRDRSASLWDVGAPGYLAAVGIDSDGEEYLALVQIDRLGRDGHPVDVACPSASHEQLGRLPAEWFSRLVGRHRCSGVNKRGQPCLIEVSRAGARCRFHRTKASAP